MDGGKSLTFHKPLSPRRTGDYRGFALEAARHGGCFWMLRFFPDQLCRARSDGSIGLLDLDLIL